MLDQENERCISVAELKPFIRQFEQLPADARFILLKTVGFIQKRMASRALSCSMKRFNDWVEAAGGTNPGILFGGSNGLTHCPDPVRFHQRKGATHCGP